MSNCVSRRAASIAAILCLAGAANAWAGNLELKAGTIDTSKLPSTLTTGRFVRPAARHVIQLDGPLTDARSIALRAAGVALGDYLPQHAFVVKTDGVDLAKVRALGFVTWMGEFSDAWKIDPSLGVRAYSTPERQGLAAAGRTQIVVLLFAGEDPHPVAMAIDRAGGVVNGIEDVGGQIYMDAVVPAAAAATLASLVEVQYVEDAPELTLRNDSNRWILQSNTSNSTPVWDKGIHGEGQIAGLIDGTPRESSCYFDDSVTPGPTHRKFVGWRGASGTDSHGTHTAGTIAGDNAPFNAYSTNDGLAFAAKISFSNLNPIFSNPTTLEPRLNDAHTDGARVHSNSWGDDGTRAYTTWCRQIDSFTWLKEDNVVAFAVSNGSISTTPENSMNVLAVGASQDTPSQGNHCSGGQGPTLDGRRKPEIYAPGCNTTSASNTTCGTAQLTGTSMACPAVTAAGLLARQYFTEGWYPTGAKTPANAFTPTGALIRAVLLNSTVDMSGVSGYPSNREGWGRLLLDNGLEFSGDLSDLYAVDVRNASGLTTGQNRTYYFFVHSASVPMRVTMAYTAPPAAVNANNPVINNLDLEVAAPGSTLYLGNSFASGQSTTGGSADAKNTVEQVLLTSPAIGWYTITVKGTAINQPNQGFAIAVTGDITGGCDTPSISDHPDSQGVQPGESVLFSTTASGSATLAYQWTKDNADIDGETGSTYAILSAEGSDSGVYRVRITNTCGEVVSEPATLVVLCPTDFNGDGFVTGDDYDLYVAAFEAGETDADFNGDGFVTGDDFDAFEAQFALGC